ncbi:MAG: hypothetical protein IKQ05_00125 [Prevotella sp.]|nr:hypothetical protein [Prevotella sp.]
MKKYKCMNIGNCDNANTGEIFEIAEGEELKCPKCGSDMIIEVKPKSFGKLGIIIGAAVVIIGAAVAFFALSGDKEEVTEPQPVQPEVEVVEEAPDTTTAAEPAQPETTAEEPVEEETKVEEPATENPKPIEKPKPAMKNPSWGVYDGPRDAQGLPHGNGVLRITRSTTINGESAQPGERIEGVFRNGYVNMGTWYKNDGNAVVVKGIKVV